MVARGPSDFTVYPWIDINEVIEGEYIKEAPIDDMFNDSEYALDAEWPGIQCCFRPFQVEYSSSTHDWVLVKKWQLYQQDRCDVLNAVEPLAKWTAYVWSGGTATPGIRVVTTAASNNSVDHISTVTTTPHWSDWTHGATRVKTDDALDTVSLYISVHSSGASSGEVWIAGFGMFIPYASPP